MYIDIYTELPCIEMKCNRAIYSVIKLLTNNYYCDMLAYQLKLFSISTMLLLNNRLPLNLWLQFESRIDNPVIFTAFDKMQRPRHATCDMKKNQEIALSYTETRTPIFYTLKLPLFKPQLVHGKSGTKHWGWSGKAVFKRG